MIYIDSAGHRVEAVDDTADPVLFFPQGGGFQCSMAHDLFHSGFKPAPAPTWRQGTVTAEWFYGEDDDGPAWPCWSNGERWNGWSTPHFTRATIDEILEVMFGLDVAWIDGKLMHADEDETYEIVPLTIPECPEPLYGLGAGCWCWNAVQFKESENG